MSSQMNERIEVEWMSIDWKDIEQVTKFALRLGACQTVHRHQNKDYYNICHTSRHNLWKDSEVICHTIKLYPYNGTGARYAQ